MRTASSPVRLWPGQKRSPRRYATIAAMAPPKFETILYEQDGPVVTITMNRPERKNAMTNRMVRETGDALAYAAEDRDVRVLVLTGAGTSFCPGADSAGGRGRHGRRRGAHACGLPSAGAVALDARGHDRCDQRRVRRRGLRVGVRVRLPVRHRRRRGSTPRSWKSGSPATWADRGRSPASSVRRRRVSSTCFRTSSARWRRFASGS